MRETEARFAKTWHLRKELTSINKARAGARSHPNGMTRIMLETLDRDERVIRAELQRRTGCDCQCPEPKDGAAGVSESCPVHAGEFHVITTVM
jgi:hypothetical protein